MPCNRQPLRRYSQHKQATKNKLQVKWWSGGVPSCDQCPVAPSLGPAHKNKDGPPFQWGPGQNVSGPFRRGLAQKYRGVHVPSCRNISPQRCTLLHARWFLLPTPDPVLAKQPHPLTGADLSCPVFEWCRHISKENV